MKLLIIGLAVAGLIYLPFTDLISKSQNQQAIESSQEDHPVREQEESKKQKEQYYQALRLELYQDVLITALDSIVLKSLNDYYGRPVSYELYEAKFVDAIRPHGYRSFNFLVKVEVRPYVRKHTPIGIDVVTIKVNSGKVDLYKFKHIKSYDLPPELKESKSIL